MALFKIMKGLKERLPATMIDGYCWYTTDDSLFYIDYLDDDGVLQREPLNAKNSDTLAGASLSSEVTESSLEIPTSKAVYDLAGTKADKAEVETLNAVDYSLIAFDVTQIVFDTSSSGGSSSGDSSDTSSATNAVLGYAVLGQMVLA